MAQVNRAVEDMTAGALAKGNELAISSYCLRRVPRTLAYEKCSLGPQARTGKLEVWQTERSQLDAMAPSGEKPVGAGKRKKA